MKNLWAGAENTAYVMPHANRSAITFVLYYSLASVDFFEYLTQVQSQKALERLVAAG